MGRNQGRVWPDLELQKSRSRQMKKIPLSNTLNCYTHTHKNITNLSLNAQQVYKTEWKSSSGTAKEEMRLYGSSSGAVIHHREKHLGNVHTGLDKALHIPTHSNKAKTSRGFNSRETSTNELYLLASRELENWTELL